MKKIVTCPICGNNDISLMPSYQRHYLSQCKSCTMVFSNIEPDKRDLEQHYAQYARNDYFSPITKQRYEEWLNVFEKYRNTSRILDVGCGMGFFLETAKNLNWQVFGTEYTDESVNICKQKGIEMFKGDIEEMDFKELKFDVIVSIEVIEHLSHPTAHLEKISHLLRPGGALYLTTPNFNSINRRILSEKWNVLSYPEHLSYFNKKPLHLALTHSGLAKKEIKTEGISLESLKTSLQKKTVDHSSSDTSDEHLRQASEKYLILNKTKAIINYLLNFFGLGESLKALYIKS